MTDQKTPLSERLDYYTHVAGFDTSEMEGFVAEIRALEAEVTLLRDTIERMKEDADVRF